MFPSISRGGKIDIEGANKRLRLKGYDLRDATQMANLHKVASLTNILFECVIRIKICVLLGSKSTFFSNDLFRFVQK